MHRGTTEKALQELFNYVTFVAVTQTYRMCQKHRLPFPEM